MKHALYRLLLCLCCVAGTHTAMAQEIDKLFVAMPDQYLPYLDSAWRKDLVDLYKSGKEATLKNTMNGQSTLKTLTADYLLLQATQRSTIELKLLPLVNNTHLICMVRTVFAPVADSQLRFFTSEWKELDAKEMFTPPTKVDFVRKKADLKRLDCIDIDLFFYSLSANDNVLSIGYASPEYMSEEMKADVKPLLKEGPLVFKWDSFRFKR